MVRLDDSLVARFPRHPGAVSAARIERRWLPEIQKAMMVEVPRIIYVGRPEVGDGTGVDEMYPASWSIVSYIPGRVAGLLNEDVSSGVVTLLVKSLVDVLRQSRGIQVPTGLSSSEIPSSYRTGQLADRLPQLIAALDHCSDVFDRDKVLKAFNSDPETVEAYTGHPVAVHTDLQPSNPILNPIDDLSEDDEISHDHITGIIDRSGLSFGDPAVDCLPCVDVPGSGGSPAV